MSFRWRIPAAASARYGMRQYILSKVIDLHLLQHYKKLLVVYTTYIQYAVGMLPTLS